MAIADAMAMQPGKPSKSTTWILLALALPLFLTLAMVLVAARGCGDKSQSALSEAPAAEPQTSSETENTEAEETEDPGQTTEAVENAAAADSFQPHVIPADLPNFVGTQVIIDYLYTARCRGEQVTGHAGAFYLGCGDRSTLLAVDAASGQEKWSFDSPDDDFFAGIAFDGGLVFSGQNNLYAIDEQTGEQRWRLAVGEQRREENRGGFIREPAAAGGTVYSAGDADGNLYALDAATGEQRWMFDPEGYMWGGPLPAGDAIYITSQPEDYLDASGAPRLARTYALDAATGEVRWEVQAAVSELHEVKVVAGGLVYVIDGASFFTDEISDTNPPREPSSLYALDAATGEERWRFSSPDSIQEQLTVTAGVAMFATERDIIGENNRSREAGRFHALDAVSGAQMWSFDVDGTIDTPLIAGPATVYFGAYRPAAEGEYFYFHARDIATGEHRWMLTPPPQEFAHPRMFVVMDGSAWFYNQRDNETFFKRLHSLE